jgi:hypothetical protein
LSLVIITIRIISGVAGFITERTIGGGWSGDMISAAIFIAPFAFFNIVPVVTYYSLRAEKEKFHGGQPD